MVKYATATSKSSMLVQREAATTQQQRQRGWSAAV